MKTLAPMLALNLKIKDIDQYVNDDRYWFEQKLDGKRLLLKLTDGEVEAINRAGKEAGDSHLLKALEKLRPELEHIPGEWCLDGEWMQNEGQYCIFDLPFAMDKITPDDTYEDRRSALESIFAAGFADNPLFRLLDVQRTSADKRSLLEWCERNDAEGIMVKDRAGLYTPGPKRTEDMMKAKFWQTTEALIGVVGREGKSSCSIWMLHEGELIDIGSIKMTEDNLKIAKTGMVVEVKYLYCTSDFRLYGPCTFLKWRDDKHPSECTTDQLRFVNKTIREVEANLRTKEG